MINSGRQLSASAKISNSNISGFYVVEKQDLSNGKCNITLNNGQSFLYDYKKAFNVNFPEIDSKISLCNEDCSNQGGDWCSQQPGNVHCTGQYVKFVSAQKNHRRGYN